MNKAKLFSDVKQLIADGKTLKAIQTTEQFLSQRKEKEPDLYQQILGLLASGKRIIRHRDRLGLIDKLQASRQLEELTKKLQEMLPIIDERFKDEKSRSLTAFPLIVVAVLTIVTVGIAINKKEEIIKWFKGAPSKLSFCPVFEETDLNTIILPMEDALSIQNNLNNIADKVELAANNAVIEYAFKAGEYPNTVEKAQSIGQNCTADFVFWQDSSSQATCYTFTVDTFKLNMLYLNTAIDTQLVGLANPVYDVIVDSIKYFINPLLLGVNACHKQKFNSAINLLSNISDEIRLPEQYHLLQQLYLAEAYRQVGDIASAIQSYDHILNRYESYPLASINRASLHTVTENYSLAIEDFSDAIAKDAQNPFSYYSRAKCFMALGLMDKAQSDIKAAKEIVANSSNEEKLAKLVDSISMTELALQKMAAEINKNINDNYEIWESSDGENIRVGNELARAYLGIGKEGKAISILDDINKSALEESTKNLIQHRINFADGDFKVTLEQYL